MLALLISLTGFASAYAAGGDASADAPNGNAAFELKTEQSNDSITVTVIGHRLDDVYAFDLAFQWDAEYLKFQKFTTPVAGFSIEPLPKENTLHVAHTMIGKVAGVSGDVELAQLFFGFERQSAAKTSILLTDVKLVDSQLNDIILPTNVEADTKTPIAFTDISGHWAEANIRKAVDLGFIAGYGDGTFRPNQAVTRAEFVTMLVQALGIEISEDGASTGFADVIPSWAASFVKAAVQQGLVSGYDDGAFRPDRLISREETASIVSRTLKLLTNDSAVLGYNDAEDIAVWARPYVAAVSKAQMMVGRGNRMFAPKAFVTRAEAVTVILSMQSAESIF